MTDMNLNPEIVYRTKDGEIVELYDARGKIVPKGAVVTGGVFMGDNLFKEKAND